MPGNLSLPLSVGSGNERRHVAEPEALVHERRRVGQPLHAVFGDCPVGAQHLIDLIDELLLTVGVDGKVVDGPREKVAGGVEARDDKGDGVADSEFVVGSVVIQQGIEERSLLVVSLLPKLYVS